MLRITRPAVPAALSRRSLALALALAPAAAGQAQVLLDVHGQAAGSRLGDSVDGAGDIDGDGIPDLIVGERGEHAHVRVLSGADGSELHDFGYASLDLGSAVTAIGDIDGDLVPELVIGQPDASLFEVRSGATGAILFSDDGYTRTAFVPNFGWSAQPAGDVDADGLPDLVVGAGISGLLDIPGDLLRVYSGADGTVIHEIDAYAGPSEWPKGIGFSVDGLGDVDGDGHDDVLMGKPVSNGSLSGALFVLSGADFHTIHAAGGGGGLGWASANAGDVDGDGLDDFVGVPQSTFSGYVRVYSGATGALLLQIDELAGSGFSYLDVDGLGDVNGDGLSDIVVGRVGHVLVYSGADGELLMNHALAGDGSATSSIEVARAGDLDGDGRSDILVGDPGDDTAGADAGRVLVLSSKPQTWLDLGQSLAGAGGAPMLTGTGTLAAGSPGLLRVLGLPPSAPGLLFIGLAALGAPFKGGTLVPAPHFPFAFAASPAGALALPWPSWPAGVPASTSIWFQAWALDATAPAGATASNALKATTPP